MFKPAVSFPPLGAPSSRSPNQPRGEKIRTRHTLGSALDSRSGGPNGKLLNKNAGSSLAGRSNRNWGAPP